MLAALGAVGGAGGGGGLSQQRTEKTDVSSSARSDAALSLGDRIATGQHGPIITVSGRDAKVSPDGGSASTSSGALPWIVGGLGLVALVIFFLILRRK